MKTALFSPVLCDYARFTFSAPENDESFISSLAVLYGLHLQPIGHGYDGFTVGYLDPGTGAKYAAGGHQQAGRAELVLPGQACKVLYAAGSFDLFLEHMARIDGIRCTRFDLAKDDFTGEVFNWWVDLPLECQAVRLHSFNYSLRKWNRDLDKSHHVKPGFTYYSGGPNSSCMVRLYDKAVERGVSDTTPDWVRLEFETRFQCGKRPLSDMIFHGLVDKTQTIEEAYKSVALQFFRLLVDNDKPVDYHNRQRVKSDPRFLHFLEGETDCSQKTSYASAQLDLDRELKLAVYESMTDALIPLICAEGAFSGDILTRIKRSIREYKPAKLARFGLSRLLIIDFPDGSWYVSGQKIDGSLLADPFKALPGQGDDFCDRQLSMLDLSDNSPGKEVIVGEDQIEVL